MPIKCYTRKTNPPVRSYVTCTDKKVKVTLKGKPKALTAKEYKQKVGKKVKNMSIQEKREYGKLRTRESRSRSKK